VTDNLEVKTKLTVDDAGASGVLATLRKSFEQTSDAQKATQAGMGFFKTSLSMAAGTYIPQAIGKIREYGESFLDAARDEMSGRKAMAGMIATMQDVPWAQAADQASNLAEQMDTIALNASRMPDDVKEAFQVMLEVGGATAENIEASKQHLTELTQVSRVLGMSTTSLAREYQFMGEGILRTRGTVFQLLQTTGIFGDKTKGAAAQWAKLTDTQRTERLNIGMAKLAERMEAAPKGMGDLLNEFHAMSEMAKESLGMPLLNALTPQLKKLVSWMKEGQGSIEEFAKSMVVDVTKYAEEAARVIREGWAYIRANSAEIKEDIVAAWGFAKTVIQFAVEHKEALAMAYGVKAVAGSQLGQQAWGAGKAIYAAGAAGGVTTMGTAGGAAMGAGALGGVAALGAFALAIGSVALAAQQGAELMKQLDDDEKADTRARYEYFQRMSQKEAAGYAAMDANAMDHFERTKHRFAIDSKLIGMSRVEAEKMADAAMAQHDANRKMVADAEAAAKWLESDSKAHGGTTDAGEQQQAIATIAKQFENANNVMDSGAQQYIAGLLANSTTLQRAFLESAGMTSTAFTALADITKTSASDFSDSLRQLAADEAKREKTAAGVPKVQFNGGQTFKIQQDFRDQDPDRIAVVFQRDILAAAERRYQSASASPFGT
jgi:hypothetical protein